MQDGNAQVDLVVMSGDDGHVRLNDYKVVLGELGLEQMNALEVFNTEKMKWVRMKWNFPLPLGTVGQLIFVKYETVLLVEGLDDLLAICQG